MHTDMDADTLHYILENLEQAVADLENEESFHLSAARRMVRMAIKELKSAYEGGEVLD